MLIIGIVNDIDIFITQLSYYGMDANALHPHTSSYRVNPLVVRKYGNFGPITRLPGNFLKFNNTVKHFRYLILKQTLQKYGRCPRNNYRWVVVVALHFHYNCTNGI